MKNFGANTINCSLEEYRNKIVRKTRTENDVCGIKVVGITQQWHNFIASNFSPQYWIRLYREDKIMQAISRYKAWKTNKWETSQPEIKYSCSDIQWCLEEIKKEEKKFNTFFHNKKHLLINYELDLLEQPEQTVYSILNYMNISQEELPLLRSSHTILRNGQNRSWKNRYLSEKTYDSNEYNPSY
jgi:LPS sulfotransferase NodH